MKNIVLALVLHFSAAHVPQGVVPFTVINQDGVEGYYCTNERIMHVKIKKQRNREAQIYGYCPSRTGPAFRSDHKGALPGHQPPPGSETPAHRDTYEAVG